MSNRKPGPSRDLIGPLIKTTFDYGQVVNMRLKAIMAACPCHTGKSLKSDDDAYLITHSGN